MGEREEELKKSEQNTKTSSLRARQGVCFTFFRGLCLKTGGAKPPKGSRSHSTGWAARLGCEQRGRLAAAVQRQLRGVRQRVQTVVSARECARERATRKRSRFQSASVCVCGHRGVCSRPRTNAIVIGQSLLASPDQRRNSWGVCSRHSDQRTFGG